MGSPHGLLRVVIIRPGTVKESDGFGRIVGKRFVPFQAERRAEGPANGRYEPEGAAALDSLAMEPDSDGDSVGDSGRIVAVESGGRLETEGGGVIGNGLRFFLRSVMYSMKRDNSASISATVKPGADSENC